MKTINSLRKNRLGLSDVQFRGATLQLTPCLPGDRGTLCQLSNWGQKATLFPCFPTHPGWDSFTLYSYKGGPGPQLLLCTAPAWWRSLKGWELHCSCWRKHKQCAFSNWERTDIPGLEVFSNGCLNGFLALRIAQFGLKRFHSLGMIGQNVICFLYRHNCFLLSLCLRGIIMGRQRTWASLQLQIDNVET